ncbi:hypothetical protein X975_14635, partial [Stegodyphus mimosarum]
LILFYQLLLSTRNIPCGLKHVVYFSDDRRRFSFVCIIGSKKVQKK